jgi:hypothetical protein
MSQKAVVLWFSALLIFAVVSREAVRGARADRCSLDGAVIEPIHRVDLMEDDAARASFCSIACALAWPTLPPHAWWRLRDEVTGRDRCEARDLRGQSCRERPRAARTDPRLRRPHPGDEPLRAIRRRTHRRPLPPPSCRRVGSMRR